MKGIKLYLVVVTVLLLVALGFGVYVWAKLLSLQKGSSPILDAESSESAIEEVDIPAETEAASDSEAIIITGDQLTETQRTALEAVGVETDTITITPEIIDCAKVEIGVVRLDEIIAGSAPGPLESLKLLGCIK